MKQSELLQQYRDEIKRSKGWRTDAGYEDEWKRYIDLYRGKQYATRGMNDQLIVNLIWSTINTISPSVSVNNPKFVVNARKPESAPQAIITEEVLNYAWRTWGYQPEFRLAVLDWLVVGHGWNKVGYKFVKPPEEKKAEDDSTEASIDGSGYGIDDRDDMPGNVESEMNVANDRPFIERISPFDMFVDPDARHPKEMNWIAQRVWRPIQDVNVDSRYSPTARKRVSGKTWSRYDNSDGNVDGRNDRPGRGPRSYCEVVEFYDLRRLTVSTFALDADDADKTEGFLIKPSPMPYGQGHPFEMLRNYEVTDQFYPIGDVAQIESLQLELNQTRSQMMNHRKRFQRKWLYEKDAFDREGVAALESDIDNTMIPVMSDGNPANVIAPLPAVITPSDFYDQSAMITNDIDRVSGVSDYQRGGAQSAIKRTATEAAMIQDSANSRAQDRLAKIEDILAKLGARVIGLLQQYMTGEQVARIITVPGRAWVNYDAEYIKGEFDFEVAAGSTEPMNETFRRQSAMQLVDASMPFLQMGVANPQALYTYILQKGFGIKDVNSFVQAPPPPAPPGMEGQGGPPPPDQQQPGAPPAPNMAPPQGAPPPMPPEAAAAPTPMNITPEMLQQLTGMGMPT